MARKKQSALRKDLQRSFEQLVAFIGSGGISGEAGRQLLLRLNRMIGTAERRTAHPFVRTLADADIDRDGRVYCSERGVEYVGEAVRLTIGPKARVFKDLTGRLNELRAEAVEAGEAPPLPYQQDGEVRALWDLPIPEAFPPLNVWEAHPLTAEVCLKGDHFYVGELEAYHQWRSPLLIILKHWRKIGRSNRRVRTAWIVRDWEAPAEVPSTWVERRRNYRLALHFANGVLHDSRDITEALKKLMRETSDDPLVFGTFLRIVSRENGNLRRQFFYLSEGEVVTVRGLLKSKLLKRTDFIRYLLEEIFGKTLPVKADGDVSQLLR